MNINAEHFRLSVASLDADLIDLNAPEELEDAVYVAAANLCKNPNIDLQDLTALLKQSLEGTDNNEFALLLTKATNVDWLYDEATEESMREVVATLLEGIEYYSKEQK